MLGTLQLHCIILFLEGERERAGLLQMRSSGQVGGGGGGGGGDGVILSLSLSLHTRLLCLMMVWKAVVISHQNGVKMDPRVVGFSFHAF